VPTLYRRLLEDAFDTLPPVLRRFHDQEAGGAARLALAVSHGNGWLCRLAAQRARLPKAGAGARGHLQVVIEGDRERWIREIAGRRIETLQWRRDNLLVEETGPLRLGFQVIGDAAGMRFTSVRSWACGLPLPSLLAPRVTAIVTGQDDGWWVEVRVELPVLGLLMRYEGEVTPE
jgi:hypothetical protein